MYEKIRSHQTTREIYANKLIDEKVLDKNEVDNLLKEWSEKLEKDFEIGKNYKPNKADWLEGSWTGFESKGLVKPNIITGIPIKTLKDLVLNYLKFQMILMLIERCKEFYKKD